VPPRHVLALFAHPWRGSFTGAVLDAALKGVADAGGTAEVADLYAEGFDPLLREADYAQFAHGAMPADVRREQDRVERADALLLVYPVWWWSLPAVLKGWFDRVWSQDWAYHFTPARARGLLPGRPVLQLCVAGSRQATYRKYGYDDAMRTQIDVGVLGYAGLRQTRTEFFFEVDDDLEARPGHLARAEAAGRELLAVPA
jgi:NAD(P)H dehydrogenase (quinone)